MRYAKTNLRSVEDRAVKFGLSETQEARFPRADLGAEQTGLNFLRVKPSQREAFAHRHRIAEEIYVVFSGTGRVKLDDDLVELSRLDAVRVRWARRVAGAPKGLASQIPLEPPVRCPEGGGQAEPPRESARWQRTTWAPGSEPLTRVDDQPTAVWRTAPREWGQYALKPGFGSSAGRSRTSPSRARARSSTGSPPRSVGHRI